MRTPLNTILGQADLLIDEGLPPHVREAGSAIRSAGEGLYSLLSDLLELARLEGGAAPADSAPFDVRDVADSVRRACQAQAWARELDLEITVDPGVPTRLRGDAGRIRQTLLNLTGNALKFTERGGVSITLEMRDAMLRVAVSDTGRGIDRRQCERLFRAFEQNENVLTRQHDGLGLGLTLCRNLVASMGGRIGVESEIGSGSTFWFTARVSPLAAPAAVPSAPEASPDETVIARLKGLRLLAADDNPLHRATLTRIFEGAGLVCEIVEDGLQAVERAGRERFDVILLDAHMPGVDGVQAARMIRALRQRRTSAALLIACAPDDVAEAEAALVSDAILRMPYTARSVLGAIGSAVGELEEPFDATGVLDLEQTVGRPALIDILASFLTSAADMTARIETASSNNDSAEMEQVARDLAGAAGGLGLGALTAAARELSQAARKGEAPLQVRADAVVGLAERAHRALTTLFPDAETQSAA
ncbi:MAG: response regulator [Alphaproteobacteria bacterium]|nr:response regulator [Alphaproteobacteria bacterium]